MSQQEIDLEIATQAPPPQGGPLWAGPFRGKHAVMPIDVAKIITTANCVVVTAETRKKLMKMVARNDLEGYAKMIAEI